MNSEQFKKKAQDLVMEYAIQHLDVTDGLIHLETYIVSYNWILGNQKALVSTTLPDGMYYEITYNKNQNEIYFDAYKKFENKCIKVD